MLFLLTGSSGQLGRDLFDSLGRLGEVVAPLRSQCDLSSAEQLRSLVRAVKPDLVVNCAAYTNVNGAEVDAAGAYAVNAYAPAVLAEETARLGSMLVHFSTDYVFDGARREPYTEADLPAPLNVYGASKLAGEEAIAASGCRHLIFRTSWVYSAHGTNFLRTMLRLGGEREVLSVVDDQVGAPTSTLELASAVSRVLRNESNGSGEEAASGLYHLTAAGAVSWCGFARRIFEILREIDGPGLSGGLKVREVRGIPTDAFPSPAARPAYSVLSNQKFEEVFGFRPGSWNGALRQVIAESTSNSVSCI